MNVGGVKSLAFIISKCLDALHMPMFPMTRKNCEPNSIWCIFIGYDESVGVKGYESYNMSTQKKFFSWDVIFDDQFVVLFF
jgi:hypothetical protein